jgi:L-seryl-tRNA(Ser) seleniumtransferase
VPVDALAPLAAEHDISIVHDLGSGLMIDLSEYGLSGEPTARDALNAGATIVLMSGDKLLGGPQAGIVLGARHAIARLRKDPFARAMRVDKLTIAALTATLELYREPALATREIPTLAMLSAAPEEVRQRCTATSQQITAAGFACSVIESKATVGAGAFPIHGIPSFSITLQGDANALEARLRKSDNPIIGRIADGLLMLDMRSVPQRDDQRFTEAVIGALT